MAYPCRAWARGLWIYELAPRAHARWCHIIQTIKENQ